MRVEEVCVTADKEMIVAGAKDGEQSGKASTGCGGWGGGTLTARTVAVDGGTHRSEEPVSNMTQVNS